MKIKTQYGQKILGEQLACTEKLHTHTHTHTHLQYEYNTLANGRKYRTTPN